MKSNAKRFVTLVLFTGVLLVSLVGCGGGGGGTPTPTPAPIADANPTGYYDVTGTASVGGGSGGTINISDLEAMVYNNRLMMMSVVNNLMYDITISKITGNDYTGTATIYTDGQNPVANVPVTGTITTGSFITGTLTGTGAGNGTFNLTYANSNNQISAISRIENTTNTTWGAVIGNGTKAFEFIINGAGSIVDDVNDVGGLFNLCQIATDVGQGAFAINGTNLYKVSVRVYGCANPAVNNTVYTGLIATRSQINVDDTLIFMMTSGTYSFSADFQ